MINILTNGTGARKERRFRFLLIVQNPSCDDPSAVGLFDMVMNIRGRNACPFSLHAESLSRRGISQPCHIGKRSLAGGVEQLYL